MISIEKNFISHINSSIPFLPKGLDGLRGTTLPNGDFVICGGNRGSTLSDEYLHYRDGSSHWTNVGTMRKARFSHSSVWIDGCLFTTGGFGTMENVDNVSNEPERAVWVSTMNFDEQFEWQATSHQEIFSFQGGVEERREMPIPLGGHTATIFAPHKIIVCGGSPTRNVNKSFFISLRY